MSLRFNDDYVRVPLPNGLEDSDDIEGDLGENNTVENEPVYHKLNMWNFEFYKQYFDVNTSQVLRRLAFSMVPNPRTKFIQHVLRPQPDIYGPFWIATTLILVTAIGGNVSSYLQTRGQVKRWHYDFGKVTLASTMIYMYWWLVPLGIIAVLYMRPRGQTENSSRGDDAALLDNSGGGRLGGSYRFLDFLSVYGYSLSVFVPASLVWTLPSTVLQWIFVILAMASSSAFLVFALFPIFRKERSHLAGVLIVGLVVIHCLFSIGLMLTFFYGAAPPVRPSSNLEIPTSLKDSVVNDKPAVQSKRNPAVIMSNEDPIKIAKKTAR